MRILSLHKEHTAELVAEAVEEALAFGAAHYEGVLLCLRQLTSPQHEIPSLQLDESIDWATVGLQPISLNSYDALLTPTT